ncbi:circularly permuted type 2 ATP-grasp protein [Synechococcus sp. WH 8020]|uniref:circularly permuted type 2 ATP-grasp protein n=1 Tax=Synechococcus sp. (strain WH8020) TaxID=32052 RepID=UPI000A02E628|nr:circularly permuted type 2 ATP-grasp protein [Synechococcus sp. WH 8020]
MNEYDLNQSGQLKPALWQLLQNLENAGPAQLREDGSKAQQQLQTLGAIFHLEAEAKAHRRDNLFPFDPLPRLISQRDWQRLEAGLIQRLQAIELFLTDAYGPQHIVRDGHLQRGLLESSIFWQRELRDLTSPCQRWCTIATPDLIRDSQGQWRVLEDNLRRGFGLGFSLTARRVQQDQLDWMATGLQLAPPFSAPQQLLTGLRGLAPWSESPTVVLLSPGRNSSARHDHQVLARAMGIALVEAQELHCESGRVWHQQDERQQVDVIYRRNDDQISSSDGTTRHLLGVPGLDAVYSAGGVAIANAPGVGVASDKLIYSHLPVIIRYYLGEEPLLLQVPTYDCTAPLQRQKVIRELDQLVVKQVSGAGGVGMLMGPEASSQERAAMAARIQSNPRHFIAQPLQQLSTVPTLINGTVEHCAVDLRPFVLNRGDSMALLNAGLTRVARPAGSLVVNATQGGGYKDTWIVEAPLTQEGTMGIRPAGSNSAMKPKT